jgi:DNA ligase-1
MTDLADGEVAHVQGSASKPYELKNTGGVYSCSCPAWRNQSVAIERRTCKHLRKLRGTAVEDARVGSAPAHRPERPEADGEEEAAEGPPLLLAERWDNLQDLTGWWMSEKLDGVRAYWDGKNFISRLGNVYHAPDWFLKGLPPTPLDGELWSGRKMFQRTVSIVRRQDKNDLWKEVKFLVFDAPSMDAPFEERLGHCRKALQARPPYAQAHDHEVCTSLDALRAELARIEALGGEGLMLRMPGSKYVQGRSTTLLKVKSFHDAEARVIGHVKGAGRHKGRLGALEVETTDGTRFSVGTGFSDAEREAPPPIGAVITFRYQELSTGGVPRFPSFVGVRTDVRWPAEKPKAAPKSKRKG